MVGLAEGIVDVMILEYGEDELLARLSDPFWFQALSCVLGYDWHSSGTTTVTCGALKMAIDPERHGIKVAGGKGKTSRKAPEEIRKACEIFNLSTKKSEKLVYSSKMSAKVDNSAIQDAYRLYHHVLIFTEKGNWCVIQQGMNPDSKYARRYHWLGRHVRSFVDEPHEAIMGNRSPAPVLNMTSEQSQEARKISLDLVKEHPRHLKGIMASMNNPNQSSLSDFGFDMEGAHFMMAGDLVMPKNINWNAVRGAYEFQPKNYEEMLSIKGVGPRTVRSLALIAELVYGEAPSWRDPVKFSFAVGGKDGVPYPVDRKAMDESIEILKSGVEEARVGGREKLQAITRLREFVPEDMKW